MKEIGGYFELELPKGKEYHNNAIALNTGRNALEYILRVRNYKKLYIPYYTCDVVLEPFIKLDIMYEFYHIDKQLKPIIDFEIKKGEAILVNNYFGLTGHLIKDIANNFENVIVDNSQAFFENPIAGVDTFYSPRKFFGVPDGAYLYIDKELDKEIEQDVSYNRFEHLLGRIDLEAEAFYSSYKANDNSLKNQPIKKMSKLTTRVLESVDYDNIARTRKENFYFLHSKFKEINQLDFEIDKNIVPMIYPLLIENGKDVKKRLIENKIFVATYWPNVFDWCLQESVEYVLANDLIPLPVDQRYTQKSLKYISKEI